MEQVIYMDKYEKRMKVINMCEILRKIQYKTASNLLQEYGIKNKPPINISLLLENIGISLIAKDFSDIEKMADCEKNSILGTAISKDDSLAIFYKANDTYHRKIFTIAHELGHCCIHADNLKIEHLAYRTIDATDKHEIKANIFAGELLIPDSILNNVYNDFIIPSLKSLSRIFDVSTNVMAARLDYLGLGYYKDIDISEE